jgi:hypothetical protein
MNSLGFCKNRRASPSRYNPPVQSWLAFLVLVATSLAVIFAQEPLPDAGSFEVEPPLLVQPDGKPVAQAEPSPTPAPDVAQLGKKLERAKQSAASAERLYKIGALAKVDAEQRALRVVRLQSELAKAQLADVQKSTATTTAMVQTVPVSQPNNQELKVVLKQAATAAETAAANLAKAELDAAALNLQRQKKLLTLGSARKSDVTRAEEKLAALQRGAR